MVATQQYDIAVVGGGIAGLYCCLHIPADMSVGLFEATDRCGGKLETVPMDGFQAEYGSMRFDPTRQPIVGKLVADLGLETEPFPEYSSPPAEERRIRYGLRKDEKGLNALELFACGIGRVLGKSVPELMATSEEELEHLRRHGTHRNRPLWQYGLWNVLSDVLSYDAITYIMTEGSFFHGIHENPGVVGTGITWVKMLQMSKHLRGIKGGMQLITDGMLERVRNRGVDVHTRASLQAIAPASGGRLTLTFNTGEFTARHVILAIPSSALRAVKGIPEDIRGLLNSVIEYPLLKVFFVVRDPWWEEDIPNRGVQNVPAREMHYYRQGGLGNIMLYADRPYANFWDRYLNSQDHDRAEIGCNQDLPSVFAERMKISPERIVNSGIRDWRRRPHGAGVHLWRAGAEPWVISSRLEAFSISGDSHPNVHICGEAFSDYQGFMEGALRSAQSALARALS